MVVGYQPVKRGQSTNGETTTLRSTFDGAASEGEKPPMSVAIAARVYPVQRKDPLTTAVNGSCEVERRRVELPTSALRIHYRLLMV
jgi:hypothetical protein